MIPKFREDLRIEYFSEDDNNYVAIYDDLNIAPYPIALTEKQFKYLKENTFENVGLVEIEVEYINLMNNLNHLGFFETAHIQLIKDDIRNYLKSKIRPSICAGNSFPNESNELKKYLDIILSSNKNKFFSAQYSMAPHIDFRLGEFAHKIYSGCFSNLNLDTELIVIFGTAHYKSSSDFMFTSKDFATPLGIIETDTDFLRLIQENLDEELNYDEIAHRPEHSLELHVVLLQHIFANKNIKIVPILTGTFENYFIDGNEPIKNNSFLKFIEVFKKTIEKYGKKTLILASGDLSHIGRKFNDDFDAEEKLELIKKDDLNIINKLTQIKQSEFIFEIIKNNNKNKVCGVSPFYSLFSIAEISQSQLVGYEMWNEIETKSAVSFCGINYR